MSIHDPPGSIPGNDAVRLEAVVDAPRIIGLHRYWQSKCGGRFAPARADIDPMDIKALLPGLFMIEVLEEPRRFRYRLIGTELVAFSGRDSTGRMIDRELYGDATEAMLGRLNEVVGSRRPLLSLSSVYWLQRETWNRVAVMFLPLSPDGERVNMILGAMAVEPLDRRPADPAATERYSLE